MARRLGKYGQSGDRYQRRRLQHAEISVLLLFACQHSPFGGADLRLMTHPLDLCILFFGVGDNSFHRLFKLAEFGFLLLYFAGLFLHLPMLFEKLIKQHRVHLVITHAVGFSSLSRTTKSGFTFSTSSATSPNCDVPAGSISFL
jgi:hypothetical protein